MICKFWNVYPFAFWREIQVGFFWRILLLACCANKYSGELSSVPITGGFLIFTIGRRWLGVTAASLPAHCYTSSSSLSIPLRLDEGPSRFCRLALLRAPRAPAVDVCHLPPSTQAGSTRGLSVARIAHTDLDPLWPLLPRRRHQRRILRQSIVHHRNPPRSHWYLPLRDGEHHRRRQSPMAIQVQDDFSKRCRPFWHFRADAQWEVETSRGVFEVWLIVHVRIALGLPLVLSYIPQSVTKHRLSVYSSRKFHIPRHSHSLKWKRVGGSYTVRGQFLPLAAHYPYPAFLLLVQCTCSSIKGPLAILQTVYISSPPRLRVYSSLFREDDTTRNQPNYGGVPHVLLDYLVTTALLLVTDIEEYLQRPGQDIGASKSAMEPFLPASLRNNRNGRGSYISTESRSPTGSNENVSSSNTLTDDARSINSEVPSTPCSTISPYHPYSFSHFSTLDPDVPPVPEIPPEHLASVPPVPPRSVVLPSTLGRIPTVRRRLPQPPGQTPPMTPAQAEQFWGLSSTHSTPNLTSPADSPDSSMSTQLLLTTSPQHSQHVRQTSEFSRSSMSINRRHIPPQRQPPQLPMPIPPKLRDDLARSMPPSATPSDGMLSSTSEISGQAGDTDSSIHEDGSVEGVGNGQPQEFLRRYSDMGDRQMIRTSAYELPPPAYDAIDFSIPRPPVLGGDGYQSFSLNSRLPPEQIS